MNAKSSKKRSRTDWARIDAMKDEDIDYSDIPKLGPEFFKNAILWPGPGKRPRVPLDADVLRYFLRRGKDYQSTLNAVLRKYMEAQKRGRDPAV